MGVTLAGSERCSNAITSLLISSINTLTAIGETIKKNLNSSIYEKLASDYGLFGLPLELVSLIIWIHKIWCFSYQYFSSCMSGRLQFLLFYHGPPVL